MNTHMSTLRWSFCKQHPRLQEHTHVITFFLYLSYSAEKVKRMRFIYCAEASFWNKCSTVKGHHPIVEFMARANITWWHNRVVNERQRHITRFIALIFSFFQMPWFVNSLVAYLEDNWTMITGLDHPLMQTELPQESSSFSTLLRAQKIRADVARLTARCPQKVFSPSFFGQPLM